MKLDDEQVKALKRARRGKHPNRLPTPSKIAANLGIEGRFHEALLDIRVKFGKHDKFAY